MDFMTLIKGAIELGVIPVLALFLVFSMHIQNRRLTRMIERQEDNNMNILKILIQELAQLRSEELSKKGDSHEG